MRLFSLGVLAASASLIAGLLAMSFSPSQSILILTLVIPGIEEIIKLGFLWGGRAFLPKNFTPPFFTAAGIFGLGFSLPETILSGSAGLASNPLALLLTIGIHLISAFFLASAVLFLLRKKPIATFALFVFSFAIHALYNFFVFIQ